MGCRENFELIDSNQSIKSIEAVKVYSGFTEGGLSRGLRNRALDYTTTHGLSSGEKTGPPLCLRTSGELSPNYTTNYLELDDELIEN